MTSYKTCAVPMCRSTTIKYPNKLFITVPKCPKRRKQWLQLARRDPQFTYSNKSAIFFCEDHFDLPDDMENYIKYSIMGSVGQIRMKPDCLPSKFQCQPDRIKRTATPQPRSAVSKRRRMEIIQEIFFKETKIPSVSGVRSNSDFQSATRKDDSYNIQDQATQPHLAPHLAPGTSAATHQEVKTQQDVATQQEVVIPPDLTNLPESKTIIASVHSYLHKEYVTLKSLAGNSGNLLPLANILARTAEATGVSEQTVTAILEERKLEKESVRPIKRKRAKRRRNAQSDGSPIEEDTVSETTPDDHQSEMDNQADDDVQMEQEEPMIETLKVEVDEEYDQAVKEKLTTDPVVSELHSTVYQLLSSANVMNAALIKTETIDIESTSAVHQVASAGDPLLLIKTEPGEHCDIQTQLQGGLAAQDPLRIDPLELSTYDMEPCPGQPSLPDQGDPR